MQAVLETKQNLETQKLFTDIKKTLNSNGSAPQRRMGNTKASPMTSSGSKFGEPGQGNSHASGQYGSGGSHAAQSEQDYRDNAESNEQPHTVLGDSVQDDPSFLQEGGPQFNNFGNLVYADDSIATGDDESSA